MSQAGLLNTSSSPVPPTVATSYVTNSGTAVPAANILNVLGTNAISTSGAGNTVTITAATATAGVNAGSATLGVASFDSAKFSVASGFVTTSGTGIGSTITGNSGPALSPIAGNWNIYGLSGSKTSGAGNTLTVKSPPYSDQSVNATIALNSGSFVTAAITLTLPTSGNLADGDLFEFVCTSASALVIQAVGTQKIRVGTLLSSAAGTATSTAIGDSISLRFRASDGFFYATSVIGTWVIA